MKSKIVTYCFVALFYALLSTSISWLMSATVRLRNELVPPKSIGRIVDPMTGVIDSICHFIIAFISWFGVDKISQIASSPHNDYDPSVVTSLEEGNFLNGKSEGLQFWPSPHVLIPARSALLRAFVCGFLAVVIDIDHFIEARSMSVDDFAFLAERPFFHNSIIDIGLLLLFVFIYWTKWRTSKANTTRRRVVITSSLCYVALIIVAFITQHNRDSERRGLLFRLCRRNEPCAYELNTPALSFPVQAIIAFCLILLCGIGIAY